MENKKQSNIDSFIFNIVNDPSTSHYVSLKAIGHEIQTHDQESPYYWDCRNSEPDSIMSSSCILQYTESGEGAVEINNKVYRLLPGSFFLIERPGPYQYWLPKDSEYWEIKFLEISINALPIWNGITQSFGRVFSINNSSMLMDLWEEIYKKSRMGGISSVFDNVSYAYQVLITLHKYLTKYGTKSPDSDAIRKCIRFIEEHFAENLTLADIAEAGELSPFYVNKTFKTILGDTPIRYLTKVRIRYSIRLLYNSDLSIDAIAEQCGFQNANYFAKVFRKYMNMSPSDFRKQELSPIIL